MFRLYQRYLAANFIPPFIMGLFFFVSFLLTTQLFRLMRVVTKKGIDISIMFELFGQIALSFLPMAVPLSLLFSLIYTLNKLSEDSEIVAIRAMGISKGKIFRPFLIIGLVCSVTIFALNRNIIPHSIKLFQNTVVKLTSSGFLADIKKGKFYTEIPNVTLFAEEVYDDGKKLEKIFIKLKMKGDSSKIIFAKKGSLIKSEDINSTNLDIRLDLFNGNIITIDKNGDEIEKIIFEKYEFPIMSEGSNHTVNKDSMNTNSELSEIIANYKTALKTIENPAEHKRISYVLRNAQMEYWSRYNIPLQCIAFVLIGFVFGIKKGRGRSSNTSGAAFVAVILYYLMFFGGVSMVKKLGVSPLIATMLPTIVTLAFGQYYYKKLDWVS